MNLDTSLIELGRVDIVALRTAVLSLDADAWSLDKADRVALAGDRPGDAIFLYNDTPATFDRCTLDEARATGIVNVLRNMQHPLFDVVDRLIETAIRPTYPHCDTLRVQIADLPPGAAIGRHRDDGILAAIHRLHVPIVTNADVVFEIDDAPYTLAEGTMYELNNVAPHAVRNTGTQRRIHLLVDMLPNAIGRCAYHDDRRAMGVAVIRTRIACAPRS